MPKIAKKQLIPKRKISMIYIDYSELNGKNVVLGVTGGIAAYKAAMLASDLVKSGANVDVIMTENAHNNKKSRNDKYVQRTENI